MPLTVKGHVPVANDVAQKFQVGLREAQHMGGRILVRRIQRDMESGKSGRVYTHPRGGSYQASAPSGESSAVVTGQLLRSMDYTVSGTMTMEFGSRGAFNGGFDYALAQEDGTSKMAPRENVKRAAEAEEGNLHSVFLGVPFRYIRG